MNIPALTGISARSSATIITGSFKLFPEFLLPLKILIILSEISLTSAALALDGRKIKLYANIGSVKDVANVLANDAAGIGLFRSEFLYLETNDYPDEESQFTAYKTVAAPYGIPSWLSSAFTDFTISLIRFTSFTDIIIGNIIDIFPNALALNNA